MSAIIHHTHHIIFFENSKNMFPNHFYDPAAYQAWGQTEQGEENSSSHQQGETPPASPPDRVDSRQYSPQPQSSPADSPPSSYPTAYVGSSSAPRWESKRQGESSIKNKLLNSFKNLGFKSQSRRNDQPQQIRDLAQQIADKFQLSTTGYQMAMDRLNNSEKSDEKSLVTLSRAQQYTTAAKNAYPSKTLSELAQLQKNYIYRTSDNELLGAIEMSPEQITECLIKCREMGFANCDMQALELALHLRYGLGISDITIVSNWKLSHNYVVINPSSAFPKGAIADSWTGQGLQELNFRTKLKFMHQEANISENRNMHEWLENYGYQYLRPF